MVIKKKAIVSIILSVALVVVLAFGALGLSACGKKNGSSTTISSNKVTKTTDKNGGTTLETSVTVPVEIPNNQKK